MWKIINLYFRIEGFEFFLEIFFILSLIYIDWVNILLIQQPQGFDDGVWLTDTMSSFWHCPSSKIF